MTREEARTIASIALERALKQRGGSQAEEDCIADAILAAEAEEREKWIRLAPWWTGRALQSPEDIRRLAVAEERERCLAAVKDEEELDGIPTEMQFCEMRAAGFVETCRAIVRATKNNIAERIRARDFQPEPPEKADD